MESKATTLDIELDPIVSRDEEIEALRLLGDKTYDQMSCVSPSTEQWCQLAERFIRVQRRINFLNK